MSESEVRSKNHKPILVSDAKFRLAYYKCSECSVELIDQFDSSTCPGPRTKEDDLKALKETAHRKLREAQEAWHHYWTAIDVGPERVRASDVYDNLMVATRG